MGHGFTDRCLQPIRRTYPKITVISGIEPETLAWQANELPLLHITKRLTFWYRRSLTPLWMNHRFVLHGNFFRFVICRRSYSLLKRKIFWNGRADFKKIFFQWFIFINLTTDFLIKIGKLWIVLRGFEPPNGGLKTHWLRPLVDSTIFSGVGFEPTTSGLWAQYASPCTIPKCIIKRESWWFRMFSSVYCRGSFNFIKISFWYLLYNKY